MRYQNGQTHSKNFAAFAAGLLKCVLPSWDVTHQSINNNCFPSYRNQSIDLQSKSIDRFLYDGKYWLLMD